VTLIFYWPQKKNSGHPKAGSHFRHWKGECIIRYFGMPCDEFAERVWSIKISDGARVTLFNKGLVSCDVNQSFLILLFEPWEYVSFMMISCIICYRRYCMMWPHLAPPPLWVSWDIVRLLTIEKTRKHDIWVMIPREEVELNDVTSYTIFDNKIYKISS
jgi:hypothetical protein